MNCKKARNYFGEMRKKKIPIIIRWVWEEEREEKDGRIGQNQESTKPSGEMLRHYKFNGTDPAKFDKFDGTDEE